MHFPRSNKKPTSYTTKVATDTVRATVNDCTVIPWEPCAALGGALIALLIFGVEVAVVEDITTYTPPVKPLKEVK